MYLNDAVCDTRIVVLILKNVEIWRYLIRRIIVRNDVWKMVYTLA
jgi:hypothetical protein